MKSGFCVLWGRPNAGKSTLLNALLGRKHAIVSARPQTTRHRITGVLHGDDSQVVFLDTPGIHDPQHKLGETLNKTAKSTLEDIECLAFVVDVSDSPHADDKRAAVLLKNLKAPLILVLNKIDLVDPADLLKRQKQFTELCDPKEVIGISALQGNGVDALRELIISLLPEGDPYFPPDMLGDRPLEFHVAELVREQALLQLHQEVPHSVAVTIEQMAPRPKGVLYIEAFVHLERASQKKIFIGEGGSRIKEIGQAARKEIETLLERKVFLELRVKVRDKWREDDTWIRRFGYKE
jgi:GTP-binding protein Era